MSEKQRVVLNEVNHAVQKRKENKKLAPVDWKCLEQFRNSVRDCQLADSSDIYLVKWLVARNFDLDQAEKMLRSVTESRRSTGHCGSVLFVSFLKSSRPCTLQSLEWRKANEIDTIVNWDPPEVLVKYLPVNIVGRDKFGCPRNSFPMFF